MGSQRYSHSQINSGEGDFRLFELAASVGETPLRGTLHQYHTRSAPVYSTVSYCWGSSHEQVTVEIDKDHLEIPTNAALTLRRLRHRAQSRLIWIDSICICQSDEEERGHQVGKMCEIYSAAECNFVYLGDEDMSQALADIGNINMEIMAETDDYLKLAETLRPSGSWRDSVKPLATPISEGQLARFFGLPWFRRVWTLQEVTLARHNICLCGPVTVDLLPVVRAGAWLEHKVHSIKSINLKRALHHVWGLFDLVDHKHGWYATHPHELHQLLQTSSTLLCTLPVDHIFGVLGILQKYNAPDWRLLKADYSIPLEEVVELACRTSITALRGKLDPIATVSHTRTVAEFEKKPSLPSWVPDWTAGDMHPLIAADLGWPFDACDGSSRSGELDEPTLSPQGVLTVSGMVAGHVSAVGQIITFDSVSDGSNLLALADLLEEWVDQVFDTSEGKEAALNCLPALLTAGAQSDPEHARWIRSWSAFRGLLVAIASGSFRSKLSGTDDAIGPQKDIVDLHPHMIDTCTNRRLCTTDTGMIGIGSWLLSKDDTVTVLDGLSLPAFLRSGQNYGITHSHQFLGIGYLHGMMDGTWARQQRLLGRKSRLFSLK